MCTVSFIPANGKIFITSNRDESSMRPLAIAPTVQSKNGIVCLAPTDAKAGGTWIAARHDGAVLVLLNGATEKHLHTPPYRKSRGQVFRDVFHSNNMDEAFAGIDLQNIEPFTLIAWKAGTLQQLQWNGSEKNILIKNNAKAQIWSSCTLYTPAVVAYRQQFFQEWLSEQTNVSVDTISDFHMYTNKDGHADKNIRINRNGDMLTVSISCIEITGTDIHFYYNDLHQNKNYTVQL